jgi:hypothetical protein
MRYGGFRIGNAFRGNDLRLFLDLDLFFDSLNFESNILHRGLAS